MNGTVPDQERRWGPAHRKPGNARPSRLRTSSRPSPPTSPIRRRCSRRRRTRRPLRTSRQGANADETCSDRRDPGLARHAGNGERATYRSHRPSRGEGPRAGGGVLHHASRHGAGQGPPERARDRAGVPRRRRAACYRPHQGRLRDGKDLR